MPPVDNGEVHENGQNGEVCEVKCNFVYIIRIFLSSVFEKGFQITHVNSAKVRVHSSTFTV